MAPPSPLDGIERYLWERLKGFPEYDWREPDSRKSPEHIWYEQGWELVYHLKSLLFSCSSSWGNQWPFLIQGIQSERRLFNIPCQTEGCSELSECLLNRIRIGTGDDDWQPLPNAPEFHCHAHGYSRAYGTLYVPPTEH